MSCVAGRREKGLFTNGSGLYGSRKGSQFSGFSWTTEDAYSGDGCWKMSANSYGGGVLGAEYVEVDPDNFSYIFSLYVKTYERSYNNRLGSGHLGFACYDENKSFISHYNIGNSRGTVLTRACSSSDTSIYIGRGDWYVGGSGHARSFNFFPPGHEKYSVPGRVSKLGRYNNAYSTTSITQISATEWRVDLNSTVNYTYPTGTPIWNTQSGGSYNYALGAPTYPEEWTLKRTGVMSGFGSWSGAGFRWGTKYIRFLNLRNYNYRSERGGDAAHYYIDNIQLIKVRTEKVQKFTKIIDKGKWWQRRRVIR